MTEAETFSTDIAQLTVFRVGGEEYVVDILRIREIIRPQPITPVRRGPKFVEGVINLRGSVIPVIDMRRRFGLTPDESLASKVMVMAVDGRTVGLIVDEVTDVVRVRRDVIRPAPGLLGGDRAPFFLGVCHYQGRTLILLNVRQIVVSDEEIELPTAANLIGESS